MTAPAPTVPPLDWLKPRAPDCHKGDFGAVAVIGGAPGMAGAALLAARAALWLGAGRVYAGVLDARVAFDPEAPEIMVCTPARALALEGPGCLVVGPGLGTGGEARDWLGAALSAPVSLLLDADALNLLALDPALADSLRQRRHATLLTPHPGEAARLLGSTTTAVQADRAGALAALVSRYGCGIVLKGAGTLVQCDVGPAWRNTTGNPGMAAPGMGDVLTGIIAALHAQGLPLAQAAMHGVQLHGAAGDALAASGTGPLGLTAGEVARHARKLLNEQPDQPG